jgi:hypothetical protein
VRESLYQDAACASGLLAVSLGKVRGARTLIRCMNKRGGSYGGSVPEKKDKPNKFNYEEMKLAATHADRAIRKKIFIEYFERFEEFPSYLFDNEQHIDPRLQETIDEISKDPEISKPMRAGIEALRRRLQ